MVPLLIFMVPEARIELARTQGPLDFESSASTSFTTPASERNDYSDALFAVSMLFSKAHSVDSMNSSASLLGDLSLQIKREWYLRDLIEMKTGQSAVLNERCAFCHARYALCALRLTVLLFRSFP